VVGDTLLDSDVTGSVTRLCPDAPAPIVDLGEQVQRPGGAGLAALLAARAGHPVTLVTALGDDPPGTPAGRAAGRRGRPGPAAAAGLDGAQDPRPRGRAVAAADRLR